MRAANCATAACALAAVAGVACWFVASRIPLRLVGYGVLAKRPRGVTVGTLDSESSGRVSNPREVFISFMGIVRLVLGRAFVSLFAPAPVA